MDDLKITKDSVCIHHNREYLFSLFRPFFDPFKYKTCEFIFKITSKKEIANGCPDGYRKL